MEQINHKIIVMVGSGKDELLEMIKHELSLCPLPEPLPEYVGVKKIKWPKVTVKHGVREIGGLLTGHGLFKPEGDAWYSRTTEAKEHSSLKEAKLHLESFLLGTSNSNGEKVTFTSNRHGTTFTIPRDVYHLTNFYEAVRKSTRTKF